MEDKEKMIAEQAERLKTAIESCFVHYEYHHGFIREDALGNAIVTVWFSSCENPTPEQTFMVNVEVNEWNHIRPFHVFRNMINSLLWLQRDYGFEYTERIDIDIAIDGLLLNMIRYSETGDFYCGGDDGSYLDETD